jgi:single-strand DNA-binding protein
MPRTNTTTQQAAKNKESNGRRSYGPSVNRATLIGRITGEVVLRFTSKGVPYARFGLATNDRPEPEFHNICCWAQRATFAAEYLAKGRLVYLEGWLHGRTWQTEDGTTQRSVEIVAENLQALTPRPQEQQENSGQE